jgi:ubiquinone/menaquinone biosynthesis C-methylase UbiE
MNYQKELDKRFSAISAGAAGNESVKKIFGEVNDDFWYWLFTDGYDNNAIVRNVLPSMPDEQIQANFTGRSGHLALSEAFAAYKLFKNILSNNSKDLRDCTAVLDFGCGWGRIIRFFLKDIEASGLWGIDCYSEMIDLCKTQNLRCNFEAIGTRPPTKFPSDYFDLIYLYSVFSHLSEEAHLQWLKEFKRILKPSGMVIATTRPRGFIFRCIELSRQNNLEVWQYGAAMSFKDPVRDLEDYDAGKFVHSPTGGGGVLETSFYGESCIPREYVEKTWTKLFSKVGYIYSKDHLSFDQDVIFAKK